MKKLSAKRISALNFIYGEGYKLKKALFLLIPALFFSCEQFPTWNEPVADWFDKYTNTAAVGRHEIQCPTYTDSEGSTCISSDGDKTVIMYLRNPRHYNLNIGFSESGATCRQDENDKAVIYLTYPESYLKAHDSGKEIGGTLTLRESVSGREFESYSFNLKCNTPPPSLMDASVQSSGGKYIICFYLPTDELISERHIGNTHTLFIDGNEIASGTAAELAALSAERPADLASLDGSPAFTGTSLSGYTPFYWETGKDVNVNDDATWILQLADNNGLKSAEATAGTRIKKPTLVLGSDITVAKGNTNVSITPQVTDFNGTAGYQVETDDTSIAEASVNNGTISINPKSGGTTSMKVTAIAGGHAAVQTINITVLEISIPTGDEVMIVGGDDTTISPTALGFAVQPEYTWESDNPSVATVDGNGKIKAVDNGTAKITVSTTYGGNINVKAEKNISVYKFTLTGDDYGFVGDSTNTNDFYLHLNSYTPDDNPISGYQSSWQDFSSIVSKALTATAGEYKITPKQSGKDTVKLKVTIGGKSVILEKQLTIYGLTITGNSLLTKTGSSSSLTLSPSLKAGSTSYSGTVDSYKWVSSQTNTATVSNGTVTAKSNGTAGETTIKLTAKIGDKTTTATKTVSVIDLGGLTTFIAGEDPRALVPSPQTAPSGVTYTWSTTDTSGVASVNSSNGKITANKKGTAEIKLTAKRSNTDKIEISKTISVDELNFPNITNGTIELAVGECINYYYNTDNSTIESKGFSCTTNPTDIIDWVGDATYNFVKITGKKVGQSDFKAAITIDGTTITKKIASLNVIAQRTIAFNQLGEHLSKLAGNDKETPVKLNITGLTVSDVKQATKDESPDYLIQASRGLRRILNAYSSIYVDLSPTTLPSGLTDMAQAFRGCESLVVAPTIPSSVTNLLICFGNCKNLKEAPAIPNNVTDINMCFENCTSLTTPPAIPSSVIDMGSTFKGCTKLERAPSLPDNLKAMNFCFSGCTSLDQSTNNEIVIPFQVPELVGTFENCTSLTHSIDIRAPIINSSGWRDTFKNCTGITKVYVINGATKNAIKTNPTDSNYVGISDASKFVVP